MAIGDKKPVVMESDKGVAGGVATLGADGILSEAERPFADQLYLPGGTSTVDTALQDKADLTLSNLTDQEAALQNLGLTATAAEINHLSGVTSSVQEQLDGKANLLLSNLPDKPNAIANLGAAVRPNLLDNAHFYSPHLIDQRQGYVVPPDTAYYSDTGLATSAGTVSAYTTAVYVNTTYGTITVDSTTYYVAYAAMVRGYVGTGYGIDRWNGGNTRGLLIKENGIHIIQRVTSGFAMRQSFETSPPPGVYTLSALVTELSGVFRLHARGVKEDGSAISFGVSEFTETGVLSHTFNIAEGTELSSVVLYPGYAGDTATVVVAKLEIGDTQTLARQLEDGSWEIIDTPPNHALELTKCQRYLRPLPIEGYMTGWVNESITYIHVPYYDINEMRATPTLLDGEAWGADFVIDCDGERKFLVYGEDITNISVISSRIAFAISNTNSKFTNMSSKTCGIWKRSVSSIMGKAFLSAEI